MPNKKTNDGKKALHIQMVETMPQDSIPAKGKLLLLLLLCFDFQFLIENFDRHGSSLVWEKSAALISGSGTRGWQI